MDSLMAETLQEKQWYLTVGDRSIGPLTTDLVLRGIQSGKVPLTAWICEVGADAWSALSSFSEFQDVVDRVLAAEVPANQAQQVGSNSPQPTSATLAPSSASSLARDRSAGGEPSLESGSELAAPVAVEEEEPTGRRAMLAFEQLESNPAFEQSVGDTELVTSAPLTPTEQSAARGELPSLVEQSGQRAVPPDLNRGGWSLGAPEPTPDELADAASTTAAQAAATRAAARLTHDDLGIDITFDEDHENSINWKERFQSYFLVGSEVELPDEGKLLQSLRETPRTTFIHDEALWNLSLCLAYGSEVVALTSASTFFEAVTPELATERIEWVCRTLLSKGFMPSGIPRSDGMRGIEMLY